jgi:shikimate dehydrogenase
VRALVGAGAPEIRLVNRTRKRADQMASALSLGPRLKTADWGDWNKTFKDVQLLVNATSLGMTGKEPLDLSLDGLPDSAAISDIVYNPLETGLLRAARLRGLRTMEGLGMLMHQAAPAFAAWFGVTPEVTPELRAELVQALRRA